MPVLEMSLGDIEHAYVPRPWFAFCRLLPANRFACWFHRWLYRIVTNVDHVSVTGPRDAAPSSSRPMAATQDHFVAVMKRERIVEPALAFQSSVRASLSRFLPANPFQSGEQLFRFDRFPMAHASEKTSANGAGTSSPWSIQSAATRSPRDRTELIAASRVVPYAITPGIDSIRPTTDRRLHDPRGSGPIQS
jgi:hypothetical protein